MFNKNKDERCLPLLAPIPFSNITDRFVFALSVKQSDASGPNMVCCFKIWKVPLTIDDSEFIVIVIVLSK